MKYEEKLQSLLDDPSIHEWVKPIAKALQDHDPVDALHDCELLVRMCKARLEEDKEPLKCTAVACEELQAEGGEFCEHHL